MKELKLTVEEINTLLDELSSLRYQLENSELKGYHDKIKLIELVESITYLKAKLTNLL